MNSAPTPETIAFLAAIGDLPQLALGDVAAARDRRRLLASLFDEGPAEVDAADGTLGGVRARTYRTRDSTTATGTDAVIVYIHGGGWLSGDLDTHDGICRRFAFHSGLEVISVDYRRPPEHRHPAAVHDSVAAISALGARQIVMAGDSAGGHIAVEAALELRALAGFLGVVSGLILIQPADDPQLASPFWESLGTGYFLSRPAMEWYWSSYLPAGTTIAPLAERDLTGLPRCFIITASLDPSQDDGIALVRALREANVAIIHEHLIGVPHGCFTLPAAFPSAQSTITRAAVWAAS